MNQKLKILVFLLILGSYVSAQTKRVTGTVTDETGVTLPGVNVVIQGTTEGTITNIDGQYSIEIEEGSQLLFRFIGYKNLVVPYEGQPQINVSLEPDVMSLDEVVVVGYGVQKKESVVGAITQAKGDELKKRGSSTNFTDVLSGAMPGVTVMSSTGIPGGGGAFEGEDSDIGQNAEILIRGKSTWNNAEPLILVDGVERSMGDIDVNEVESISVLKDASATAVFGVKGANGVILITTKRGKEGKPVLNIEANTTFKQASRIPTVLNSYEGIRARNFAAYNEVAVRPTSWGLYVPMEQLDYYRTQEYPDGFPEVDWEDVMLKDWGRSHKINMNVSGGTDFVKYFSSLGYSHEGDILNTKDLGQGYVPDFRYDRYNFRTNLDFELTKTTKFQANLSGYLGKAQKSAANVHGMWYGVYAQPHDHPVVQYEDGTYGHGVKYERFGENNFVDLNFSGVDRENRAEVNSDFKLTQDLSVITEGLSVGGMLAFDQFFKTEGRGINDLGVQTKYVDPLYYVTPGADIEDYTTYDYPDAYKNQTHGFDFYRAPLEYSNEQITNNIMKAASRKLYYRGELNYARDFNEHAITFLGLFSREETYSYRGAFAGFPTKREDWVSRLTYNYDTRYFLDVSGAYNGSQKFGPGYKFDFFPSVAIGWTISNETFFQNSLPFVNTLKVRYSNGKVGNDRVSGVNSPWLYATTWNEGDKVKFGDPLVDGPQMYKEGTPGNPDVRWEVAHKQNLGVEIGVLQNLVSMNVDLFRENRTDILIAAAQRTIPDFYGQTASATNSGEVISEGAEFEARFSKAHGNGLRYWASLNWTYAENEIIYKEDPELKPDYQKNEGYSIGQTRSMISSELMTSWDDVYTGTMPLNDRGDLMPGDYRLIDFNADGVVDGQDGAPYGYPKYPLNTYSFAFGGEYKGFSLMLNFYGVYNVTQNISLSEFGFHSPSIYETQIEDTFTPEIGNSNPSFRSLKLERVATNAEYYQMDASFLRLKTAEIGYSLPDKWISQFGISDLRLYVNGNNLLYWSDLPVDIEGQDFNVKNYPVTKQINLGLNVTF
ncbi:SusC/RagA family TonB-linked outer membrane protein [Thermophagus sp. OGC60D27]|uniref:SusC/RagA family TonB-linked outer membrane protein n=1 Tax=Thermophagus sp. OGC60D27 TaxID=3458415 RepID=UPI0040380184